MRYKELQALTNEHLRCARSLCYLLDKPAFQEAYEQSQHKKELIKCIVEHDYVGVRSWWRREILVDVTQLPVKALRQLASFYGVPDYHLLRKWELQDEILNARANTDIALRDDVFLNEGSEAGSLGQVDGSLVGVLTFDFGEYLSKATRDTTEPVQGSGGSLEPTQHDTGALGKLQTDV